MSLRQLVLEKVFPSAPTTTRAIPTRLSAHANIIAYGSGHNVVVRNFDDPSDIILCGLHSAPVTAVRMSPTGRLIASGDQSGAVIVWTRDAEPREVLHSKQLQGAVRDIGWTADEERLVVAGEGKNLFAVAITITANTIGSINGHAQNILSCDMRGERPYRIVTGSADAQVGFYEGVPFKFKCNVKGHKNAVTCVRYSPDMETVAGVSSASDIILYDGQTGAQKSTIATGHTGTIYSVAWSPDGRRIASASADKTVKVFDVATGATLGSCALNNHNNNNNNNNNDNNKGGGGVCDMQQAVVFTSRGLLSVSLGGALTFFREPCAVRRVERAHQSRVLLVHSEPNGALVTVSADCALLRRRAKDKEKEKDKDKEEKEEEEEEEPAEALPTSPDACRAAAVAAGFLFTLSAGGEVRRCDLARRESVVLFPTEEKDKDNHNNTAVAIAATDAGAVVLLARHSFSVIAATGEKTADVSLGRFDGACAAARGEIVALGGDAKVKVFRVPKDNCSAPQPPALAQSFDGRHAGTVACVAISPDGERIASGDAGRNIFVWSLRDGSVLYDGLVFHTLRVAALAFSPACGERILSGGVDAAVIRWELKEKRRRTRDAAHRGGVSAVAWTECGDLVSGGCDGCVRVWKGEE